MALFEQIIKNHSEFLETQKISFFSEERKNALDGFKKLNFPNKKNEEYKYTSLEEIINKEYSFFPKVDYSISQKQINDLLIDKDSFDRVVFINGQLSKEFSNISNKNIELMPLCSILENEKYKHILEKYLNTIASSQESAFSYLNTAFFNNVFFLHIPKNTIVERPIYILNISQNQDKNTFYNTRNLLIVEENSKIEIVESHYNFDNDFFVFTNAVTEIFVASNAQADWHKLQNDGANTYLVDNTFAKQEKDSLATVNTLSFGGKIIRNNLDFIHNGENINSFMNGVTVIGKEQLVDHHTAVHHNKPNCESYQNYKGIFKDKAHGVFNGKVFVDKIAQKTNAYQQNNNILLDKGAVINTKPQLEIFADDVKCSHGCTVGQLNKEALFYLRARGISKNEAQALLLYAFANDTIANINIEPLKLKVFRLLAEKLEVNIEL